MSHNLQQIKSFARDFINGKVTDERKRIIQSTYFQLTGESLRTSCKTCYVEAIYLILKMMEKAETKYRLKKGALLQAFGDESKTCTNINLTDELAEWHLKNTRGARELFDVIPDDAPEHGDKEIVKDDTPAPVVADAQPVSDAVAETPVKTEAPAVIKPKPARRKTSKKAKK